MPRKRRHSIELLKVMDKIDTRPQLVNRLSTGYEQINRILRELEYAGCVVYDGEKIIKIIEHTEIDWKWEPNNLRKIAAKQILERLEVGNSIKGLVEDGLSLSPTAIKHYAIDVPEIRYGVAMVLSMIKYYVNKGDDENANHIASLWVCLNADSEKYPELKEKIDSYFDSHKDAFIECIGPAFKEIEKDSNKERLLIKGLVKELEELESFGYEI